MADDAHSKNIAKKIVNLLLQIASIYISIQSLKYNIMLQETNEPPTPSVDAWHPCLMCEEGHLLHMANQTHIL